MRAQRQETRLGLTSRSPVYRPERRGIRPAVFFTVFGGLVLLLALYFVGAEQGATSLISGMYVHEFVHDGRHLLGFPCH